MQSREAGQSIGGRGCQRECLQDPGRPGNAPEGQVVVDSGRSLVGRWRCGARAGSRAAMWRRGGCVGAEVAVQKVPKTGDNSASAALGGACIRQGTGGEGEKVVRLPLVLFATGSRCLPSLSVTLHTYIRSFSSVSLCSNILRLDSCR
jgi:hypothetical protein